MPAPSPLALTTLLYGAGVALWLAVLALGRRSVPVHARAAAGFFWLTAAGQSVLALVLVTRGTANRPIVVVAYAVAGLALMPVLVLPGFLDPERATTPALTPSAALAAIATVAIVARLGVLT